MVTIGFWICLLTYSVSVFDDLSHGVNDTVTYNKFNNDYKGHRLRLNATEIGFMPFFAFDAYTKNKTTLFDKGAMYEEVLAEPPFRNHSSYEFLRFNFTKLQKYGKLVGLVNKTVGNHSMYLQVEYRDCTDEELKDLETKFKGEVPTKFYACPDFSKIPNDKFFFKGRLENSDDSLQYDLMF